MADKYKAGVQLATCMLHQWRGQWKLIDCKVLSAGGVLAEIERWIRDLWTDAPGRIVAVSNDGGRKGIIDSSDTLKSETEETNNVRCAGQLQTQSDDTICLPAVLPV